MKKTVVIPGLLARRKTPREPRTDSSPPAGGRRTVREGGTRDLYKYLYRFQLKAGMTRKFCLIGIIVLAAFLRFYKLGQIPPSLDWDEVSLAYNAWSLAETGRDEFGNSWPTSIKSFSDYKPPVYTYLLIPTLKIFGKTEFAVRFPSALAGTLTVLATYWLTLELFGENQRKNGSEHSEYSENQKFGLSDSRKVRLSGAPSFPSFPNNIAIIAALLLAISPWHLQFSRIGFEANVGLFFFVVGMWCLLRWLNLAAARGWWLILSSILFSLALMSYHSLRIVAPLVVISVLLVYRQNLWEKFKTQKVAVGISTLLTFLTLLILFYTVFFQNIGQSRFKETSFFTIDDLLTVSRQRIERFDGNLIDRLANHRYLVYGKQILRGYLDHFDLKFWLLEGDRINRHRTPSVGLMYWWELPFLVMGLISILMKSLDSARDKKLSQTIIFWFLLAPAASALTGGTPSAVRSLVFLPTFQILTAIGLREAIDKIRIQKWRLVFISSLIFIGLLEINHYFHQYYVHYSLESAPDWQYGYKQLVEKLSPEKKDYGRIIVTTSYDQPYIYFLWYGNYDPKIWVNDGEFNKRFDKFEFRKIDWPIAADGLKTLVVGTPKEIPAGNRLWQIDYPDGQTAFVATERL